MQDKLPSTQAANGNGHDVANDVPQAIMRRHHTELVRGRVPLGARHGIHHHVEHHQRVHVALHHEADHDEVAGQRLLLHEDTRFSNSLLPLRISLVQNSLKNRHLTTADWYVVFLQRRTLDQLLKIFELRASLQVIEFFVRLIVRVSIVARPHGSRTAEGGVARDGAVKTGQP